MRVLVVGHGAREHAIVHSLVNSPQAPQVLAFLGLPNPGIIHLASSFRLGPITSIDAVSTFAREEKPDLAIVSQDDALAAGIVDMLATLGIPCAGPTKDLAAIEWDKSFLRRLMKERVGYGYPRFEVCKSEKETSHTIAEFGQVAVKPLGLTGGKGVKVMGEDLRDLREAVSYAAHLIDTAGEVLIEEKVVGEEYSLMVFTDGNNVLPMPLVQDHKRAYVGDTGPMTGGMGSYSCPDGLLPFVSQADYERSYVLLTKVLRSVRDEVGAPFRGVLYGQFMLTSRGPVIIETNARFGDPEAMNVLSLLRTDFVSVCQGIVSVLPPKLEWEREATVCKYLVPDGYPENPRQGVPVLADEQAIFRRGVSLYYASVSEDEGRLVTSKSRTLALVARAATVDDANEKIDEALNSFEHSGLIYRPDIGSPASIRAKVEKTKRLSMAI